MRPGEKRVWPWLGRKVDAMEGDSLQMANNQGHHLKQCSSPSTYCDFSSLTRSVTDKPFSRCNDSARIVYVT